MKNVVSVPSDVQRPPVTASIGSMWKSHNHDDEYNVFMVVEEGKNVDLLSGQLYEDDFDFPSRGWIEVFELSITRVRERGDDL